MSSVLQCRLRCVRHYTHASVQLPGQSDNSNMGYRSRREFLLGAGVTIGNVALGQRQFGNMGATNAQPPQVSWPGTSIEGTRDERRRKPRSWRNARSLW